jgi:hypothetical protein
VRYRWDVKQLARAQLEDAAIVEGDRRCAGEDESNVFNMTAGGANSGADMLAPLPARL